MSGAIVFLIGGALQTGAQNLGYLYAGRAVAGLGVGVLMMIIPLYQAEIAHPAIRGRITALQQFMLGIGAVVASRCPAYLQQITDLTTRQHGLFGEPTRTTTATPNGAFHSVSRMRLQ